MRYVIVGAGTAGAVLAARLSEDHDRRVLLLEAGPDFASVAAMPPALRYADRPDVAREHDWALPVTICGDRAGILTRGRVVGGSAQVNQAGALRGAERDFDAWARAARAPAWRWDRVLPAYCRLETDEEYGDSAYHGDAGPVGISRGDPHSYSRAMRGFLDAVIGAGHPYCPDMNRPGAVGIGPYPHSHRDRVRQSTAVTHLLPARERSNLTVRGETTVDRVVIEAGRAVGVQARDEVIRADEVVVCAGTPLSAALLLRSGVGPAEDLRALGLPVHADLAGVGANLIDQPGAVLPAIPTPGAIAGDSPLNRVIGRLARIPGFASDDAFYLCLFVGSPPGGGAPILALMVGDMAMSSRGTIRLASADPSVAAVIDCGFYRAPGDLGRMVAMYRHAFEIANREAFSAAVAEFMGVDDVLMADDERLGALVRATTFTRLNPVGGVAMGDVVDEQCRVHGIAGLRVVDLSIMPVPLRAPAALTAMMIGEHAAALMR